MLLRFAKVSASRDYDKEQYPLGFSNVFLGKIMVTSLFPAEKPTYITALPVTAINK